MFLVITSFCRCHSTFLKWMCCFFSGYDSPNTGHKKRVRRLSWLEKKNNFRRKICKALGVLCQSRRLNQYNFQPYTGINFWLMTWFTKLTQQIFLPYLPVTASKACDWLTLLQYLNVYYVCTVGKQYLYPIVSYSFLSFVFLIDLRSRLLEKKGEQNEVDIKNVSTVNESKKPVKDRELSTRIQQVKPQKEAVRPRVKQCAEKKSTAKESTSHVKERELDERIQRIKQQNEAILKRAKEIEAEKMKFHSWWNLISTHGSLIF